MSSGKLNDIIISLENEFKDIEKELTNKINQNKLHKTNEDIVLKKLSIKCSNT